MVDVVIHPLTSLSETARTLHPVFDTNTHILRKTPSPAAPALKNWRVRGADREVGRPINQIGPVLLIYIQRRVSNLHERMRLPANFGVQYIEESVFLHRPRQQITPRNLDSLAETFRFLPNTSDFRSPHAMVEST